MKNQTRRKCIQWLLKSVIEWSLYFATPVKRLQLNFDWSQSISNLGRREAIQRTLYAQQIIFCVKRKLGWIDKCRLIIFIKGSIRVRFCQIINYCGSMYQKKKWEMRGFRLCTFCMNAQKSNKIKATWLLVICYRMSRKSPWWKIAFGTTNLHIFFLNRPFWPPNGSFKVKKRLKIHWLFRIISTLAWSDLMPLRHLPVKVVSWQSS